MDTFDESRPSTESERLAVLAAIQQSSNVLAYAPADLQADREVVLAALANEGAALAFASSGLQADRHIVLSAVNQDGLALAYAAEELQSDRVGAPPAPKLSRYLRKLLVRARGQRLLRR